MKRLPTGTLKKLKTLLEETSPGSKRAQIINMINFKLNEGQTIAGRIYSDHWRDSDALRAMSIFREAGAATESVGRKHCYGTFTFEDGSTS